MQSKLDTEQQRPRVLNYINSEVDLIKEWNKIVVTKAWEE